MCRGLGSGKCGWKWINTHGSQTRWTGVSQVVCGKPSRLCPIRGRWLCYFIQEKLLPYRLLNKRSFFVYKLKPQEYATLHRDALIEHCLKISHISTDFYYHFGDTAPTHRPDLLLFSPVKKIENELNRNLGALYVSPNHLKSCWVTLLLLLLSKGFEIGKLYCASM